MKIKGGQRGARKQGKCHSARWKKLEERDECLAYDSRRYKTKDHSPNPLSLPLHSKALVLLALFHCFSCSNMSSEQGSDKPVKTKACAACKFQRKRCLNCPLAPFFPPDQAERFENVHRLYGVNNVLKILKLVQPIEWQQAMETIKFEADLRRNNPVFGCCSIIDELKANIESCKKELDTVNQQLSYYRQRDQPPSRAFHYLSSELAQSAAGTSDTEKMEQDWAELYEELEKMDSFDQNQTTQTAGVSKIAEASSSKSAVREKQSVRRRCV